MMGKASHVDSVQGQGGWRNRTKTKPGMVEQSRESSPRFRLRTAASQGRDIISLDGEFGTCGYKI
jgi:ribosomal protein L34